MMQSHLNRVGLSHETVHGILLAMSWYATASWALQYKPKSSLESGHVSTQMVLRCGVRAASLSVFRMRGLAGIA